MKLIGIVFQKNFKELCMCLQCLPYAVGSPQAASSVLCMLGLQIFCVCVGLRMIGIFVLSKPLLHMLRLPLPQDTDLGG